jgi:hypothetical protein
VLHRKHVSEQQTMSASADRLEASRPCTKTIPLGETLHSVCGLVLQCIFFTSECPLFGTRNGEHFVMPHSYDRQGRKILQCMPHKELTELQYETSSNIISNIFGKPLSCNASFFSIAICITIRIYVVSFANDAPNFPTVDSESGAEAKAEGGQVR